MTSREKLRDRYFNSALLAYISQKKEDAEEMLFNINKALELGLSASDQAIAHYIRGVAYIWRERYLEAEVEIKKAFELDETLNNNALLASSAFSDLAKTYKKRGEIPLAIKTLERATTKLQALFGEKEFWALASVHFDLAAMYLSHKNKLPSAEDNAFLNLQRACQLHPKYAKAIVTLGMMHTNQGKYYDPQKAIQYYNRFLHLTEGENAEYGNLRKMVMDRLEYLQRTAQRQ